MRRIRNGRLTTVLAFVLGVVVATAGTATAAKLITGKQIKDGSISAKDLSKAVQAQLAKAGTSGAAGANGQPGSAGPTGTQGTPGQPGADGKAGATGPTGPTGPAATNLFAYVRDTGAPSPAVLAYGKGATEVSDPAGENNFISPYVVTFDQDLTGCVAQMTVGFGEPNGSGASGLIGTTLADIDGSTVKAFSFSTGALAQDTSFMLSVFC